MSKSKCTLGVGCAEAGICYAEAMGDASQCGDPSSIYDGCELCAHLQGTCASCIVPVGQLGPAARAEFDRYWIARQRERGYGSMLTDAEMLTNPERRDDEFHAWTTGRALLAVPAATKEGNCRHRIADARNAAVQSGYVCTDCGALFAAADHATKTPPELPKSDTFAEWCTTWFGPDSDESYLSDAVAALPKEACK